MFPRVAVFVLATVLAACATSNADTTSGCPPSRFRSGQPVIIAHASGDWFGPANSIEMMGGSLAAGAEVLDLDIRMTADGILVASHDDGIGETSIGESTLQKLLTLDLRDTWSNPKQLAFKNPVRIPTVESVFAAFPDKRFSLEFKVTGGEQKLCDLLRENKRTQSVYVSSAGDAAIDNFTPLCPEVVTTVTDAMVPIMQAAQRLGQDWCAPVPIGQPPLNQGDFTLTKAAVDWEHAHGLAVYTWTADDEESLRLVKSLGVDGVYTARPDLARAIFDEGQYRRDMKG
jgi:glycerophosphoryl diester phosphodiesterase